MSVLLLQLPVPDATNGYQQPKKNYSLWYGVLTAGKDPYHGRTGAKPAGN